jgi:DNA repair protein RecO (recombination protein O)
MNAIRTPAIILARTDYGEADRILTMLTPEKGKLRLLAKGVRKVKSKLAGGIELFSTSDISYLPGRKEIGTLVSARLITHYGNIINDLDRLNLGYELIKQLNKATEDQLEPDYYYIMEQAFAGLNDPTIDLQFIRLWFTAQLLRLSGHTPNLQTDISGQKLAPTETYTFDFDSVAFTPKSSGTYTANHIKTLRLLFSEIPLEKLSTVGGIAQQVKGIAPLIQTLKSTYTHL